MDALTGGSMMQWPHTRYLNKPAAAVQMNINTKGITVLMQSSDLRYNLYRRQPWIPPGVIPLGAITCGELLVNSKIYK